MRLSRPVFIIAAAISRAAPTRANAVLEKPPSAILKAPDVPSIFDGLTILGAVPSRKAMSDMMIPDETG